MLLLVKRGAGITILLPTEKKAYLLLIFDGKVYFTSFVPPTNQAVDLDAGVCGFSGQGRLYVFDLHKGTRTYNQVYYEVGERVPDTPQIVIPKPEDGERLKHISSVLVKVSVKMVNVKVRLS